jgi:hypothetical protein
MLHPGYTIVTDLYKAQEPVNPAIAAATEHKKGFCTSQEPVGLRGS